MDRKNILNCFRIGKLWYGIIILSLQIYTHYDMFRFYIQCKNQLWNPRYGLQWNEMPINVSLIIWIFSLALLPIFLFSCLMKTGNLVNDDIKLGDAKLWNLLTEKSYFLKALTEDNFKPKFCEKVLYQLTPSAQILHFVSAMILIIPQILMDAERFRNAAIHPEYLWTSDLHSIFNVHPNPHNIIVRQGLEKPNFPIATVNYVVAAIFLSLQTSSVFWRVSKSFAITSAIYDSLIGCGFLFLQSVLRVTIRYYVQNGNQKDLTIISKTQLYSSYELLTIFMASFMLFIISRMCLFEFGIHRYLINQRSYYKYLESSTHPSISQGLLQNSKEYKEQLRSQMKGFGVNLFAGFIWIIATGLLVPIACYLISTFIATNVEFVILGFSSILVIIITWCVTWIVLSIKRKWLFHVSLNPIINTTMIKANQVDLSTIDPIYTCFHENRTMSRCSEKNSLSNGDFLYNSNTLDHHQNSEIYQLFNPIPPQESMSPHHLHKMVASNSLQNLGNKSNGHSRCNSIYNRNSLLQNSEDALNRNKTPNYPMVNVISEDSDYQSGPPHKYSTNFLLNETTVNSLPIVRKPMLINHNDCFIGQNNNDDNHTDISTDFSDHNTTTNSSSHDSNKLNMNNDLPYRNSLRQYQPQHCQTPNLRDENLYELHDNFPSYVPTQTINRDTILSNGRYQTGV